MLWLVGLSGYRSRLPLSAPFLDTAHRVNLPALGSHDIGVHWSLRWSSCDLWIGLSHIPSSEDRGHVLLTSVTVQEVHFHHASPSTTQCLLLTIFLFSLSGFSLCKICLGQSWERECLYLCTKEKVKEKTQKPTFQEGSLSRLWYHLVDICPITTEFCLCQWIVY